MTAAIDILRAAERRVSPPADSYICEEPRSMPEFRLYRPKPGHPDWPRLFAEARELADRLRPELERPRRGPAEWRRRAAAYRTAVSNYGINWRLNRQGREDLRPLYFIWTMLRTCNFLCTYCDDHQGKKYPELPNTGVLDTEQGKRLLRVMRTRTPSVYFAGGEPTVRKDLPELTRYACDLGYYPTIVNTNGSLFHRLLAKPSWRSWLADIDIIVISLDSLDLSALRDLWVFKRPHHVLRNLLMLRELADELGFKLMVNTVIQPDHIDWASDVLDLTNDLGIWFICVPVNVGPRIHSDLPGNAEYLRLADTILARKRAGHRITGSLRLNRRMLRSEKLSCRNALKPHIDYDGRLVWPCKSTVNVAPEYVNVLDYDHVDDLYEAACERVDPTNFHGPAKNQCGGDCNWAQNYTTDAYAHGLAHPTSLFKDILEFVVRR